MVLSICTPSFSCPSPHVDVAFEKCAVSGHRPGAGVPSSGRGGRLCSECVGDIRANVFQSIDQTVALDGLSKALFLNLCWQAMTWWRRGRWIDYVLSLPSLSPPSPLCPIPLSAFYLFFLHPPPPSFSTHRLDVSSTRCQIISQQTLRCVTEDWSCISLDDTSSAPPSTPLLSSPLLPSLSLSQTTSNIAGPFWSLKRLVLGEKPVLKQKQTKCFICHVCQRAICAVQQLFFFCQRGGKPHGITHYGTLKRARLGYTEMSAQATRPLFRNFFFFMFLPRCLRVCVSCEADKCV